jgi:hypothetical protein
MGHSFLTFFVEQIGSGGCIHDKNEPYVRSHSYGGKDRIHIIQVTFFISAEASDVLRIPFLSLDFFSFVISETNA